MPQDLTPASPDRSPVLAMILKGYPRISETFISNEILLLEQMGLTLHIISMRQPRENFSHASVKAIKARVDYLPEELLRPLPLFLWHNFRLALQKPVNYLKATRLMVRRLRRNRRSATIKHLLQAGYLVHTLLPGSGIRHLHAHFAHSPSSVAMFAALLSDLPFSFTAHAKDIYTSNPAQLREKIDAAAMVVTCTGYNREHLRAIAPDTATPIHRIYHGIDLALFKADTSGKTASRPDAPFQLLTIARLTPKKGLPTVLRALRRLKDKGLSITHTLIGDGDDRDLILERIKELGLTDVTRWLGVLPHEAVLDHYRRADLFVLGCEIAANGDRDGIPNVLVESMAMGVPVVATHVSAIPELVIDGETGLLVRPKDPSAMAQAIERLLTDLPLRQSIISAARRQVTNHFDNQILVRDLGHLYQDLLTNPLTGTK